MYKFAYDADNIITKNKQKTTYINFRFDYIIHIKVSS